MKSLFGEHCQLPYTNTDSLLLEIQTKNVDKDMAEHADFYDTSGYPTEEPLHSKKNKKVH